MLTAVENNSQVSKKQVDEIKHSFRILRYVFYIVFNIRYMYIISEREEKEQMEKERIEKEEEEYKEKIRKLEEQTAKQRAREVEIEEREKRRREELGGGRPGG